MAKKYTIQNNADDLKTQGVILLSSEEQAKYSCNADSDTVKITSGRLPDLFTGKEKTLAEIAKAYPNSFIQIVDLGKSDTKPFATVMVNKGYLTNISLDFDFENIEDIPRLIADSLEKYLTDYPEKANAVNDLPTAIRECTRIMPTYIKDSDLYEVMLEYDKHYVFATYTDKVVFDDRSLKDSFVKENEQVLVDVITAKVLEGKKRL